MGQYYTYAWLRVDGTPYYIGKGSGSRAWRKDKFSPPPDRVLILKRNLCESDAFKHEVYMIAVYGRKDLGTGILHNFTDGGEGTSGRPCSEETRLKISLTNSNPSEVTRVKMSKASTGRTHTRETRQKIGQTVSARFTGEGNPFFGKTHTETTRQKISEATSGDRHPLYGVKGEDHTHFGKKWWINVSGETLLQVECPGEGWRLGRK
jgi:hypothetical protein